MASPSASRWGRYSRALWLRGFLPAVVVLLWTIPSMRSLIAWQWGTPNASMPWSESKRVQVSLGQLGIAWGPGGGARAGEPVMGQFMENGPISRVLDHWSLPPRWLPRSLNDQLFVPLWLISMGVSIPPAVAAVRRRLAHRAGQCTKCGYSRAGLPEGAVCPECATAPPGSSVRA